MDKSRRLDKEIGQTKTADSTRDIDILAGIKCSGLGSKAPEAKTSTSLFHLYNLYNLD